MTKLLQLKDAAEYLSISESYARRFIKNNIPSCRMGARICVKKEDLDNWIEAHTTQPSAERDIKPRRKNSISSDDEQDDSSSTEAEPQLNIEESPTPCELYTLADLINGTLKLDEPNDSDDSDDQATACVSSPF